MDEQERDRLSALPVHSQKRCELVAAKEEIKRVNNSSEELLREVFQISIRKKMFIRMSVHLQTDCDRIKMIGCMSILV